MGELSGKVALVTGGASGIGEAAARALAAAGAKVAVGALHEERAKPVADAIVADGGEAMAVAFDTSNEEQVAAGIGRVVEAFGGIDILHNNAALTSVEAMMRDGMVHELDTELWDQTMAINVRGYMLCTKYAVPSMLQRGGGVVINTASGAGQQGELVRPAYGTSKAAVMGFTRSVATQYGKMGIRAVTVMPGMTMTSTIEANVPPPIIEMMIRHSLTAGLPRPEDVANAIVFLASDKAAFITGAVIPVDGGFGVHSPSFADEVAMWAAASGAEGAAAAQKFRAALDARSRPELGEDDRALLQELFAEDVVWHGAGIGDEDDARGRSALVDRWNELARNGEAAQISVGDVYADGTHVIAVLDVSAPGAGSGTVRQANIFHLNEEGKASELWSVPSWGAVALALSSGEAVGEHPNLAPFRAAEEARARNEFGPEDMALIERFLREDVKWISPWGQGPSSRDEVVAQFGQFNQATGGTMQLDLNEVFADDRHAVSLVRLQADRPDRPDKHMDVKEANVFHLDEDGKAYEFWGVADNQAAINEFWT
jgi:NAD(P)-dependent dehydrogenase (short-subunit alcohol dehydrogenase family)